MSIEVRVFCRSRPALDGELDPNGDIHRLDFTVERTTAWDWDELRQAGYHGAATPQELPWMVRFTFAGEWYDGFDAAGPAIARRCGGGLLWGWHYDGGEAREVAARPDPGSWPLRAAVQVALDMCHDYDEAEWRAEIAEDDAPDAAGAPARRAAPLARALSGAAYGAGDAGPRDTWFRDPAGTTFAVLGGTGEAKLLDPGAFRTEPDADLRARAAGPVARMQALAGARRGAPAWSMACCASEGTRVAIASIGDARAYHLTGARGMALLTGSAATREIVTRALEGSPGDVVFLCTRGLWSELEEALEDLVRDAVETDEDPATGILRDLSAYLSITGALAILCL